MTCDAIKHTPRDITEIARLRALIEDEAVKRGNASEALLAEIAPIANIEAWGYLADAGRASDPAEDEDPDDWWPAQQYIHFWADNWRRERGHEHDGTQPSFRLQIAYIRDSLDWATEREPMLHEFAADMRRARAKLENLLREGLRPTELGIPCVYDECNGTRLERWTISDGWDANLGRHRYRLTDWTCPSCERTWDDDAYMRMTVRRQIENGQRVGFLVADERTWVSIDKATEITGQPRRTIWMWLARGDVAQRAVRGGGTYVDLDQLRSREAKRAERVAKRILATQTTSV